MPDPLEPPDPLDRPPGADTDRDMFVEDVEASFTWKSIPLEGWICIPIFWVLAAVVFWQFFTRYALSNSAVWTEEIARQLLILLTFFGAAFAMRMRAHICIGYFVDKLPAVLRRRIDEMSCLLQLAFYGYSAVLALKVAKATAFQKLMSFDVSKSLVYYAVAAAFALLALRSAVDTYRLLNAARRRAGGPAVAGKICSGQEHGR